MDPFSGKGGHSGHCLILGSPGFRPQLILLHQSSVQIKRLIGTDFSSAINLLCDLSQVTPLFWASVFSFVKQEQLHLPGGFF